MLNQIVNGSTSIYTFNDLETRDQIHVVEDLHRLFVARDDTYALQTQFKNSKWGYSRVENSLKKEDLQEHLAGKKTVGLYEIIPETGFVKWGCLDIDGGHGENITNPKEKLKQLWARLVSTGIAGESILIEESGSPESYHLWVFFKGRTKAEKVRTFLKDIVNPIDAGIEVFPKQTEIRKDKFGNLVKLPFGYHQAAEKWSKCHVQTNDLRKLSGFAALNAIVPAKLPTLPKLKTKGMRPCFKQAIKERWQLNGNEGNNFRIALVGEMIAEGYTDEEIHRIFEIQNDYVNETTQERLEDSRNSNYKPWKCETIKDKCPGLLKGICATCNKSSGKRTKSNNEYTLTLEELKAEDIDYGDTHISNYLLYKTITNEGERRKTYTEVWREDEDIHEEICQPIDMSEKTAPSRDYQNGERVGFPEIYKKVLDNVTTYGAFDENSIDPILISLGSMISYYIEAFEHVPYFDYTSGEPESGKTTVATLQTYMAFRGNICMSVREAPIFRELDETHCFYLIDNSEHLFSMPRNNPGIIDMLLASHTRGVTVPRVAEHEDENGKRAVTHYDCFGIKVFTHIHSIPPVLETLRTRCIPIYMQRGIPDKVLPNAAAFSDVRDMQYLARHYEFDTIKKNYNEIVADQELTGRTGDIYSPLLAVAKEIDPELYERVLTHAKRDSNSRHALNPRIGLLIQAIHDGSLYGKRSTTGLASPLNMLVTGENANARLSTPRSVNDMLRKLGLVPCELRTQNLTWFDIKEKIFTKKAYEYGILSEDERKEYEEKIELEKLVRNGKLVSKKETNFSGTTKNGGKEKLEADTEDRKGKVSKLVENSISLRGNKNKKEKLSSETGKKVGGGVFGNPWVDQSTVVPEITISKRKK